MGQKPSRKSQADQTIRVRKEPSQWFVDMLTQHNIDYTQLGRTEAELYEQADSVSIALAEKSRTAGGIESNCTYFHVDRIYTHFLQNSNSDATEKDKVKLRGHLGRSILRWAKFRADSYAILGVFSYFMLCARKKGQNRESDEESDSSDDPTPEFIEAMNKTQLEAVVMFQIKHFYMDLWKAIHRVLNAEDNKLKSIGLPGRFTERMKSIFDKFAKKWAKEGGERLFQLLEQQDKGKAAVTLEEDSGTLGTAMIQMINAIEQGQFAQCGDSTSETITAESVSKGKRYRSEISVPNFVLMVMLFVKCFDKELKKIVADNYDIMRAPTDDHL